MPPEPPSIAAIRKRQTEAANRGDWVRVQALSGKLKLAWATYHTREARKMRRPISRRQTALAIMALLGAVGWRP